MVTELGDGWVESEMKMEGSVGMMAFHTRRNADHGAVLGSGMCAESLTWNAATLALASRGSTWVGRGQTCVMRMGQLVKDDAPGVIRPCPTHLHHP